MIGLEDDIPISRGSVVLSRDRWQLVIDALEGDESCRDGAFDALQRWAPPAWLAEQENRP